MNQAGRANKRGLLPGKDSEETQYSVSPISVGKTFEYWFFFGIVSCKGNAWKNETGSLIIPSGW